MLTPPTCVGNHESIIFSDAANVEIDNSIVFLYTVPNSKILRVFFKFALHSLLPFCPPCIQPRQLSEAAAVFQENRDQVAEFIPQSLSSSVLAPRLCLSSRISWFLIEATAAAAAAAASSPREDEKVAGGLHS